MESDSLTHTEGEDIVLCRRSCLEGFPFGIALERTVTNEAHDWVSSIMFVVATESARLAREDDTLPRRVASEPPAVALAYCVKNRSWMARLVCRDRRESPVASTSSFLSASWPCKKVTPGGGSCGVAVAALTLRFLDPWVRRAVEDDDGAREEGSPSAAVGGWLWFC